MGVATTKLVAKIASDLRKPDGLVVVAPGDEAAFLAPLPIGRLWGVGGEDGDRHLPEYGVKTIGDLADPLASLLRPKVRQARRVAPPSRAVGLDDDPVHEGDPAKSVEPRDDVRRRSSDPDVIERTLLALSDGVAGRLRSAGVRASTSLSRSAIPFRTVTRQRTLPSRPVSPSDPGCLGAGASRCADSGPAAPGWPPENLGEREPDRIFADTGPRRRKAIEAADAVRRRYGSKAVTRGRSWSGPSRAVRA